MTLVEIYVNDQEVAGEYVAQAFFEWNGQEWEMTVKAASKDEAEALAKSRAGTYLVRGPTTKQQPMKNMAFIHTKAGYYDRNSEGVS